MLNANAFDNLKEGLTQPLTIVRIVKSREAKKAAFDLPLCGHRLLNLMASYRQVAISIRVVQSRPLFATYIPTYLSLIRVLL